MFDQKAVMGVKRSTRRKKVRFMRYFSIITAAATSLTILPVFDGITVYHAIVYSHYMPHTIVIIVLCRDIWRKIKVDEEK